jgi:hypothetical protein
MKAKLVGYFVTAWVCPLGQPLARAYRLGAQSVYLWEEAGPAYRLEEEGECWSGYPWAAEAELEAQP